MGRSFSRLFIGVLLTGCAESTPEPPKVPLAQQASKDLACPANRISLRTDDTERVWRAEGCDKYGIYMKSCGQCLDMPVSAVAQVPLTKACDCRWVLQPSRSSGD